MHIVHSLWGFFEGFHRLRAPRDHIRALNQSPNQSQPFGSLHCFSYDYTKNIGGIL